MSLKARNNHRRESIKARIAEAAGGASSAAAVAVVFAEIKFQIEECLVPVLGPRGVQALFNRALSVTSLDLPWISAAKASETEGAPQTSLRMCLAEQSSGAALAGGLALMLTFTELLELMIGIALTEQLLSPLWPAAALPPPQERTHE